MNIYRIVISNNFYNLGSHMSLTLNPGSATLCPSHGRKHRELSLPAPWYELSNCYELSNVYYQ
jgi:hypothetical protein